MSKFGKELPMSPWKLIIYSVFSLAVIILLLFFHPLANPFGTQVIVGVLTVGLLVSWWGFYYKLRVCEIEIAGGFVSIFWKSRTGKEKQASRQPAELYYQRGSTGGKAPQATLDLYEKDDVRIFKRPFMRIIDGTDGWKLADFTTIEEAFNAAGLERKERQKWFW